MGELSLGITVLSLVIWLFLLGFWGQFWRLDQRLEGAESEEMALEHPPLICAVIPARNEAELLPVTLRSLLTQDYPGNLTVVLVDDHSSDGTATVAKDTAEKLGKVHQLRVILAEPLPAGWSGKLWAMAQGIQAAQDLSPDYFLLTDADIKHDRTNLQRLVTKAIQQQLDLTSVMVRLRCESLWEALLIPAFVFFFQKLYPFRWVNHPHRATAAAAGGCILIRRAALERIGGIQVVRQALIDDCALAKAVKSSAQKEPGKIWLGLSDRTRSLRPYPSLQTIWDMVARTAYTQLNYSPLLLVGTLVGMVLVYLVPPIALIGGALTANWTIASLGLTTWLLMSVAYYPTVRFYRGNPGLALGLPAIAGLYTLMTLDSALRHWQGRGGSWKGRVYSPADR